ncbi:MULTISPECIES: hypothetical protein [Chryseobacterium]|uniref:Lipoprotein n=1 Tax=Chryseobacterium pennae TaxID=2258962 RepID=A0A3D9CDE9_9FLAO|nr:hypothetical protein [Chryseobacterium pennae]REC63646.1 hypothetical protein DRF65_02725 [Chryseobacterium pennae]
MKKIIFTLASLFIIYSCGIKPKISEGYNYKVIKIDSIENTYLIYAEKIDASIKNTAIIKIVSAKTKTNCKRKDLIIVDKNYKFNLISLYPKNLVSHNLRGITYNGTLIPFDREYNVKKDLFITDNINGLCYKEK